MLSEWSIKGDPPTTLKMAMSFWDISYHPPNLHDVLSASIFSKTKLYVLRNLDLKKWENLWKVGHLRGTDLLEPEIIVHLIAKVYKKDCLRESRVSDIQERHLGPEETAFVKTESSSSKPCSVKHCYVLIYFSVPRGKKMFWDQISSGLGILDLFY